MTGAWRGADCDRRARSVACAALVGLAALLVLAVHRHHAPSRGYVAAVAACSAPVTWAANQTEASAGLSPALGAGMHGAFWFGVLSLASGVAIVRWAGLLRIVRVGGRCGH